MNDANAQKSVLKTNISTFFQQYRHGLILLYLLIYFPWFGWLEKNITKHFHIIHMSIDDAIPFVEYFIIPYLLWFAYIAITVMYFFLKNKNEFYRLCAFLFVGMTVFLIISTVYPNGHYLRPTVFERENIFTDLVRLLYRADTPTNLFPSIHVYNSIGVNIAIWHSEEFKKSKSIRYGSAVLMVSIILSTMFLKQHSVFDVITGIVFSVFMYTFVYAKDSLRIGASKPSLENRIRRV